MDYALTDKRIPVGLPLKQRDVFIYIVAYHERYHAFPSRDSIQNVFQFKSKTSVAKHLAALERKGFIRVAPRIEEASISRLSGTGIKILTMEEFLAL